MKAFPVRTTAAAALLLALAACGGKASFDVAGVFVTSQGISQPLANSGLVLQNGSDNLSVPVGATTFKFANSISYGTEYDIKVLNQPNHMTCSVVNGSGSAGHTATIAASVICTQNTYSIGGTVSGITDDYVVTLTNGSTGGQVTLTKDTANFTFATPVADGQAYGVTVLSITSATIKDVKLGCSVANGTDVMGNANRANIVVTCAPK
jgi:hypothetical protein